METGNYKKKSELLFADNAVIMADREKNLQENVSYNVWGVEEGKYGNNCK